MHYTSEFCNIDKTSGAAICAADIDPRGVADQVLQILARVMHPETGVMNAAGYMDTPTIVWLSHSTPINLTKYWKNKKLN